MKNCKSIAVGRSGRLVFKGLYGSLFHRTEKQRIRQAYVNERKAGASASEAYANFKSSLQQLNRWFGQWRYKRQFRGKCIDLTKHHDVYHRLCKQEASSVALLKSSASPTAYYKRPLHLLTSNQHKPVSVSQ